MEKNTIIGIILALLVFIAILQFIQLGNIKEAAGISGSVEDDAYMQMLKEMHPEEYARIKAKGSGSAASGASGAGMVGGC